MAVNTAKRILKVLYIIDTMNSNAIKNITFLFGLVTSSTSYSNTISLSCMSYDNKYSMGLDIDLKSRLVSISGRKESAFIDNHSINFSSILNGTEYFHSLNRSTGLMVVAESPSMKIVDRYSCNLAKNKF